jgi:O-antigen ligase
MTEKAIHAGRQERRPGRVLSVFKAVVLLALLGVTGYGMLNEGLYGDELWLPVAAGILLLLFITLFIRDFFRDIPAAGWVLVVLLATLVGMKGLSMAWTVSEGETIKEVVRASMYTATFVLTLAALSAERQIGPVMDVAILITAGVTGYGLLQKIRPLEYPVTSLDGVRVGSTLDYANTTATVIGIGVVLALARMAETRNPFIRGLYAAAIVAFAATIYLTASRGGIATLALGIVVLLVLTGNRLQTAGNLILLFVPGAFLIWRILNTEALLSTNATNEQKLAAGSALLPYLILSLVVAFVLQAAFAFLIARYELMPLGRKTVGAVLIGAVVVVVLGGALFVVARNGGVGATYEALTAQPEPERTEDVAQRLSSTDLGFRTDYWRVAWEKWKDNPLTGTGAGTFQFTWLELRPEPTGVKQVHNLYLEQGTETGVFAFLALLGFAGALVFLISRAAWRSDASSQGGRRTLLAGLGAAVAIYLSSSILEWHWYIPPSTLLFFILAGAAAKLALKKDWNLEEEGTDDVRGAPAIREDQPA